MPVFEYQVMDRAGAITTGKIEAESEEVVSAKLRRMEYMPLDVRAARPSMFSFSFKKKVNHGELSMFSRQLAAMLNAGIPLTRCLFALGEQSENQTLAKAVLDIARNVETGMTLTDAMSTFPEVFNEMYVDLIKAGEVGGTLEEVLLRLAQQLNSEKALRDSIRAAMFYPVVVLAFAFLIMVAMLIFIVPVFLGFYPPDVDLPFLTAVIIGISEIITTYWYLCLFGFIGVVIAIKHFLSTKQGKYLWDKTKLNVPIFGSLVQKTVVARFSRTLSTLLAGGIPILQALETAGPAAGNVLITKAVDNAGEKIQEGQSIATPLKESGLFPPMVVLMVSVGEETGDLPGLLTKMADFYEAEVATLTKGLTSLIEPLMLIFVGGIVAVMVISLYLPMFSVITNVQ